MRRSIYLLAVLVLFGCEANVGALLDDSDIPTDLPVDTETETMSDTESETETESDSATETLQDTESETNDTSSDSDTETDDTDSESETDDTDSDSETTPEPTLHPLTPHELNELLPTKDFQMINVHIPDEGEVPGTDIHISYLDAAAVAAHLGSDLGVMAVIYCKSNGMAMNVGAELVTMGYYNLHYLDGGMDAWENAGYSLN